jgi:hypothetical protein
MFAPADMKDDERAISLKFEVSEPLISDKALAHELYESVCLLDESGQKHKPGAALAKENTRTYIFAIPKALEISVLRLSFEEGQAEEADSLEVNGLEAVLGKWDEKDNRALLPGGVTWDVKMDELEKLFEGEDTERAQWAEDVFVLIVNKDAAKQQADKKIGYAFGDDQLIYAVQMFEEDAENKDRIDEIRTAFTKQFGEENVQDFSEISPYLKEVGIDEENMLLAEKAPWCAWLLPDQNTLVWAAFDGYSTGILYFNISGLQGK